MGIKDSFKKLCENLGKSNKPTYAVMAIATVKGIARPTFTMMDKTEDPETKKYTAIREGLTEVVAIPTYWGCGELTAKLASKMNLAPEKLAAAQHNLMFVGVCTAALLVIPAVTSLIIKPLMKTLKARADKKKNISEHKLDMVDSSTEKVLQPTFKSVQRPLYSYNNMPFRASGMKVGGIW